MPLNPIPYELNELRDQNRILRLAYDKLVEDARQLGSRVTQLTADLEISDVLLAQKTESADKWREKYIRASSLATPTHKDLEDLNAELRFKLTGSQAANEALRAQLSAAGEVQASLRRQANLATRSLHDYRSKYRLWKLEQPTEPDQTCAGDEWRSITVAEYNSVLERIFCLEQAMAGKPIDFTKRNAQ